MHGPQNVRLYTNLNIVNHLGCFYYLKDFALRSPAVKTNRHQSSTLSSRVLSHFDRHIYRKYLLLYSAELSLY